MKDRWFLKVGAGTPRVSVGDPTRNAEYVIDMMERAREKVVSVLVLPELCLTGYTCRDLFNQEELLSKSRDALEMVKEETEGGRILVVVGLPLMVDGNLYNCAVPLADGRILGAVPKTYLPNYGEFYEKRWFNSGRQLGGRRSTVELLGDSIPVGDLLFRGKKPGGSFLFGIEICEDLWAPVPPSSYMGIQGADLILNPSASNGLVGKSEYRRRLITQQSARCMAGYVYAGAGVHESTTDTVFEGESFIAENGRILEKSEGYARDPRLIRTEIDLQKLDSAKRANTTLADGLNFGPSGPEFREVEVPLPENPGREESPSITRSFDPHPFVPEEESVRDERCEEIFQIQASGLATRLERTGIERVLVGVSGGLDSTLALLVAVRAFSLLGRPRKGIVGVTMPGFGTSERTKSNAEELTAELGVDERCVNISDACRGHFRDIGHPEDEHDVTYENAQARERTQILMDLANYEDGLVVGTSDLSELALGWTTYNGDHMSMYAVNTDVPKTLVRFLVEWVARNEKPEVKDLLLDVSETPISPELLPGKDGKEVEQETERIVGPFELHDFFLYHFLRFGSGPEKIFYTAKRAFAGSYREEEILEWLEVFHDRFFSQQFKRSSLPDGPKVGTVSLSPRTNWRMPSDAGSRLWKEKIEELKRDD